MKYLVHTNSAEVTTVTDVSLKGPQIYFSFLVESLEFDNLILADYESLNILLQMIEWTEKPTVTRIFLCENETFKIEELKEKMKNIKENNPEIFI